MGAVVATSSARVIRAVGYAGALRAGDPNHGFLPREVEPEARTVIASDADANAAAEERRVPLLRAMPMPICRCGSSFDAADRTLNSFGPSDTYARTSCAPCAALPREVLTEGVYSVAISRGTGTGQVQVLTEPLWVLQQAVAFTLRLSEKCYL